MTGHGTGTDRGGSRRATASSFLRPIEVRALQGANAELSPMLTRPHRIMTLPSPGSPARARRRRIGVLPLIVVILLVADVLLLAAVWLALDRGHDAHGATAPRARSSESRAAHALVLSGDLTRQERHPRARAIAAQGRARAPRGASRTTTHPARAGSAR